MVAKNEKFLVTHDAKIRLLRKFYIGNIFSLFYSKCDQINFHYPKFGLASNLKPFNSFLSKTSMMWPSQNFLLYNATIM